MCRWSFHSVKNFLTTLLLCPKQADPPLPQPSTPLPALWHHHTLVFLVFFFRVFILFLAVLGLRCSVRASHCGGFSYCGARALEHRLSSCGARAFLLRGMWDLPGLGLELVSPALAGGFLTTVPPGKPYTLSLPLLLGYTIPRMVCLLIFCSF